VTIEVKMKSLTSLERFLVLPELLDRVENDEDLLAELFALFQEDLPGSRAALRTAIERAELPEIERVAHRLKGMLANLSAKQAASLAAVIESAARAGDTEKIWQTQAVFDPELSAFSAKLDSFMAGVEN